MKRLPSGIVTFLFIGVKKKPELSEKFQELLCKYAGKHQGEVFQLSGGRLCAVFINPLDAIHAALETQKELPAGLCSTALHTGEAFLENGDYSGPAISRVSKLLSIAHAGQVVVSSSTELLVRGMLPPGASLRDLGSRPLGHVALPRRIFQLMHPDLPVDFPPLESLEAFPHNLPVQLTSFVGRKKEVEEIISLLQTTRHLTLTGIGGCGKTRLSLEIASRLLGQFPDGVWFVDLSLLRDPGLVQQAAASALGMRESKDQPLSETLFGVLQAKKCFLILDNCEHLVEACAKLVSDVLQKCSRVQVLATSREPLRVPGEVVWRVPSLSFPGLKEHLELDSLLQYDAVHLFVERASLVSPAFKATEHNAKTIAQICGRLDGIPFAIELAAARVSAFTPEQISRKLNERFNLLAGGVRTRFQRQQTLRAMMDWSFDLLSGQEKILFSRLSIFSGSFSLAAAEEICVENGIQPSSFLNLFSELVDKSLIFAEETEVERARYRLLETVREYAMEKLRETGELDFVSGKHSLFFLRLAEEAAKELNGPNQFKRLSQLEIEHENLRAALEWYEKNPEGEEGEFRFCAALFWFWRVRGYLSEGREHLGHALTRTSSSANAVMHADLLYYASSLAFEQGDYSVARMFAGESLGIFKRVSNTRQIARALYLLGDIALALENSKDALGFYEESLSLFRELKDNWNIANLLTNLGVVAEKQGEFEKAERLFQNSLPIYHDLGDLWRTGLLLNNLGDLARLQGNHSSACAYFEQALGIFKKLGDRQQSCLVLAGLGLVSLELKEFSQADFFFKESLKISKEIGDNLGIIWSLEGLGYLAEILHDEVRFLKLIGSARSLRGKIGLPLSPSELKTYNRCVERARLQLGEEAFSQRMKEGEGTELDAAIAYALQSKLTND